MKPIQQPTYSDGYRDGLLAGKRESRETIEKLKSALDKALAENLARRPITQDSRTPSLAH